ncbi:hypothetical protein PMIN06_001622 [Paraphaeosphaeria minitans]|uniref:Uncharacterized protein n=1 Tax=Paraphaeosphaeria minitans TaxID=565426 RepID=A0A9P6GRJ8_9PLEO|nr:hypothetical protein PMIN01_00071 [Paraphaeosphaeria minitans]
MCFYHAYAHRCGHTEMIFIQMCAAAQMIQRKCPRGQEGVILTTVKVEHPCSACPNKVKTEKSPSRCSDEGLMGCSETLLRRGYRIGKGGSW